MKELSVRIVVEVSKLWDMQDCVMSDNFLLLLLLLLVVLVDANEHKLFQDGALSKFSGEAAVIIN